MSKEALLLGAAVIAGVLCCLSLILSRTFIWAARLLFLPSFVGCIVFLAREELPNVTIERSFPLVSTDENGDYTF